MSAHAGDTRPGRPDAAAGVRCPSLIGLRAERELLEHSLDEAAGGTGRLAWAVGSAGVGKTRLVDELRAAARRRGDDGAGRAGRGPPHAGCLPPRRGRRAAGPTTGEGPDDPRLAAFRPALAGLMPGGSTDAQLVELAPLEPAEVGEMARRCLGPAPVPAAVTNFVHEHADGIPLFVEVLLEGLLADGALAHEEGSGGS